MTRDCNCLGKFNLEGIPPAPRGVPQIDVTFDIDANGILNVTAVEKGTGKANHITITNEKGRLSKEDIEKMVREAEKFKSEDDLVKGKIEAKNGLEHYIHQAKTTVEDEKLKDKISEEEKTQILTLCEQTNTWLETHQDAAKEDFEAKQKEIETVFNPIMTKV